MVVGWLYSVETNDEVLAITLPKTCILRVTLGISFPSILNELIEECIQLT